MKTEIFINTRNGVVIFCYPKSRIMTITQKDRELFVLDEDEVKKPSNTVKIWIEDNMGINPRVSYYIWKNIVVTAYLSRMPNITINHKSVHKMVDIYLSDNRIKLKESLSKIVKS